MLKYELYVNLALEMCERVEKTDVNKIQEETIWDATLMRFQVIGENLRKIPEEFKKNKEIKWKELEWFRNVISHEYSTVYPEVISNLIKEEIPKLKKELEKIKNEK